MSWDGKSERRERMQLTYKWRWRALAVWIAIFTVLILYLGVKNRDNINDLKHTKASVDQIRRTNDLLKISLLQLTYSRLTIVCATPDDLVRDEALKSINATFRFIDSLFGGHRVATCRGTKAHVTS